MSYILNPFETTKLIKNQNVIVAMRGYYVSFFIYKKPCVINCALHLMILFFS